MRYDAVLFDLDGTLTASAPGITGSVRHTLEAMGAQPLPDEVLSRFVGPPLFDSFQEYSGMTPAQAEVAVSVYRDHYPENGLFNATVFQGIPNLLRALRDDGVYLAIATAKPLHMAVQVLEHFGLARFFDNVVGATLARKDASKESLLRDALPKKYARAAMVGDRRFDIEAAKAVGIDAIGVAYGYGSRDELSAAGADAIAGAVPDLHGLLLDGPVLPQKGFFITMEGLDKSGKTTQMNAVADHIRARGYDVLETREPGGTRISEEIRQLVLDPEKEMCAETESLLYAAARAQHVHEKIRPALEAGRVVLCDRFVDSSIVYQGAGRELGIPQVTAINAFAIGGTLPDLTLLFVIDAATALLRRSSATNLDRLERSGEEFFSRVYDAYAKLSKSGARFRCIDACRAKDFVTKDACREIDRLLASR